MNIFLTITRSQQMALTDILAAYMRMPDEVQTFVDVVEDVTTTTPDLLTLVLEAHQPPTVSLQMLIDAGLNGFALELLSESLAGKKDIKTFKPLRFEFRGVIYTLEPAKVPEPPAEEVRSER